MGRFSFAIDNQFPNELFAHGFKPGNLVAGLVINSIFTHNIINVYYEQATILAALIKATPLRRGLVQHAV